MTEKQLIEHATALGGIGCNPRRAIPRTICFSPAAGCSAVKAMSLSFIALMRDRSVLDALEEDDLLIFCRLSE
jgi:hypothetical protein